MMKCVETRRERKVLPGQWCVTGDIRELVQGQPSLTATTPLDIHPRPRELCSADMGQWRLEMCVFITPVCVWLSFRSFVCVCVCELLMCLSACIHTIWFLEEQLPRWSCAARRRVGVFRQRAGNLNLHTPCLQLPDLLPQEPGLLLHASTLCSPPCRTLALQWPPQRNLSP